MRPQNGYPRPYKPARHVAAQFLQWPGPADCPGREPIVQRSWCADGGEAFSHWASKPRSSSGKRRHLLFAAAHESAPE